MLEDLLPELADGRVRLLDHGKLLAQFYGLERAAKKGGRDTVDHAPRGHDDLANAATLALLYALDAATAEGLPTGELSEHDRSEMASVNAWLGGARGGEVVDDEGPGYVNEETRWSRVDPSGRRNYLW